MMNMQVAQGSMQGLHEKSAQSTGEDSLGGAEFFLRGCESLRKAKEVNFDLDLKGCVRVPA